MRKRVGILGIQGGFEAHAKPLARLGVDVQTVRTAEELQQVDGLVLPGGESSTMIRVLRAVGLWEPLREFGQQKPMFGTCAGAILLARHVSAPEQESLGLLDINVERNAYGRQLDSHITRLPVGEQEVEAVFIRAPIIRHTGPDVQVLARHGDDAVLVEQGHLLAATFHPELSDDTLVHELFVEKL